MAKLIATIIMVVVVLGLIGTTVWKIKANTEELGAKTEVEQNKIIKIIDNPGSVSGDIVKEYYSTHGSSSVSVFLFNNVVAEANMNDVQDKALFDMDITNDSNGDISSWEFTQIDLSN